MSTRLFHISDVHFGVENPAALASVARAIEAEKPDALLCTGDLTQRAKRREYAAAARWFGQFELPILFDPGNHDMPYYNLWERFTDPYRRYRGIAGRLGGALTSPDALVIPLKTTVRVQPRFPWSDGFVTRTALARTLEALREVRSDSRTKLITCHHPLLGPAGASRNPTIGGERAFAALVDAGADAFLSGHVHVPFDQTRSYRNRAARMIGTGTLSTRLRRGAPPSYRVIECDQGRIMTDLRELSVDRA
ncbi:MAG: metallophosphoesterase [Pseudomonadota bacterium]